MSESTALGIIPNRRPIEIATFRNSHGWAPSIWRRLLIVNGLNPDWMGINDLDVLWQSIETQPEWQQIPNVLTFDSGVIPFQEFARAADMLDEFERRCPAPEGHANHVPAVAALLRSMPEVPFFGMYGTNVSENPFDPWDEADDAPGNGIGIDDMYVLRRHTHHLAPVTSPEEDRSGLAAPSEPGGAS